jgi:flagellin-like hook-associated protein FlgL
MSNVSLTSGMKSALLSLQSTQKLYDKTQERLTTGKKVTNPADDPAAYYSAATLNNQADALEGRLDNMEQAVEAIKAADNGIESMISVLSSMTAIVESALATKTEDTDTRAALGKKFNDLLVQLSTLADDSAYGGTNLLDGQDITVQMGENYNDSTFTVEGFYVAGLTQYDTDTNGEVSHLNTRGIPESWGTNAHGGIAAATNYVFALNLVENPTEIVGIQSYGSKTDEEVAFASLKDYLEQATNISFSNGAAAAASSIQKYLTGALRSLNGVSSDENGNTAYVFESGTTGKIPFGDANSDGVFEYYGQTKSADVKIQSILTALNNFDDLQDAATNGESKFTNAIAAAEAAVGGIAPYEGDAWEIDWTDADTYSHTLSTILNQIEEVNAVLETRSKLLSFDSSTISLREDYTEEFINTLEEGADNLTLADLNEESANLLSLETSQSLAVQAMSLANEQMQNVLRLLQ